MKVRIQGKRRIAFLGILASQQLHWQRIIDKLLTLSPEEEAAMRARQSEQFDALWADISAKQAQRQLVEEAFIPEPGVVLHAQTTFTVAKKSTGEIVGTYDDLADAEEAVLKAQRQKKAALVITNL